MTHEQDPSKRVPKSLHTDASLVAGFTLGDVAVALLPGVVIVLLSQVALPANVTVAGYSVKALALPIAGLAILGGGVVVSLAPSHLDSLAWFETIVGFYRRDTDLEHEAATEYTHVEQLHPDQDAIERTDGTFVGLVQVEPPNMALATDAEWAQKADSFQEFLNTVVEFPIQIFSTTQEFPVDEYLGHYESRLDDPDVKENPQLARLVENYVDWYEAELQQRQMTIRDHYVVVTVRPVEVQFERESLAWKLAAVPVVGVFVRAWLAPSMDEQQAAMFDALSTRRRRVESGLREIEDCSARQVSIDEATELLTSFWAGEPVEYGHTGSVLVTSPLIDRQQ